MLVIRLFRVGKVNQPSFKIVVTDKRKPPRAGRFVEEVGFWNPVTKEKVLRQDRIKYWLSVGAKPSPTIHNLLISEKIVEGKKIPLHKKKKIKEGEVKPAEKAPAGGEKKEAIAEAVKTEAPKEKAPVPAETPKAEMPKAEAPKEPIDAAKNKEPKIEASVEKKKIEPPKKEKKIEAPKEESAKTE